MEKLEATILELMREDGKSEEEVFEMVNNILIKTRKKAIRKKVGEKKKGRRKPVCRPVLLISDSSCDEKIE